VQAQPEGAGQRCSTLLVTFPMKGPQLRIPPLHYVSRLSQTNSECWRSHQFQNVGRAHRPRMYCVRLCPFSAAGNNWQPSRAKEHHRDGKKAFSNIVCSIIGLNITLLTTFFSYKRLLTTIFYTTLLKADSCTKPAHLCVYVSKWNGPVHNYLLRIRNFKECVVCCECLVYRQSG